MAKSKEKHEETLQELEKVFGKGVIVSAKDKAFIEVKHRVKTGSITLDSAIEGGIPKDGKCTCIIGKESSSKTTLLLHIIANDQKQGNDCCFIDVEGTLDLQYAQNIGCDLSKLKIIDDKAYLKSLGIKDRTIVSGEEWLELTAKLISSNIFGIVALDSVAALVPAAELQNGMQGGRMAGVASMAAKGYRLINGSLKDSTCAFIYLNQFRLNPGAYVPLYEPFGEAFKYLQSLKIEISKSLDKDTEGVYGIVVKGKITKSKVCTPYKKFEYYVEFGKGIIEDYEISSAAIKLNIITKLGNSYYYGETKLGVGLNQLETFLKDNVEYYEQIKAQVLNRINETIEIDSTEDNITTNKAVLTEKIEENESED